MTVSKQSMTKMNTEAIHKSVSSFVCRGVFKDNDLFLREPAHRMFAFFGTREEMYRQGIIARIRQDISEAAADKLLALFQEKSAVGADFRVVYPSKRADGSACMMQVDGYAGEAVDGGRNYDLLGVDISDLIEAQQEAELLNRENRALTEDSPVGLGVYHIRGNHFDLVYTNAEYYRVHHGSRAFWDKFKGQDAMNRIVPEDRELIYKEWRRISDGAADRVFDAKYRVLGEDEQLHWVELKARLTDAVDGERVCYACYLNIDAEKAAEAEAAAASKNLLNTLANLPTAASLYDMDAETGAIKARSFTDGFCQMRQATQEQAWKLYGENAFGGVHPDDSKRLQDFYQQHFKDHVGGHINYRVLLPDGTSKWISANFKMMNVGQKAYMYVDDTDIDEMMRHEERLEQQYADAQHNLESMADTYVVSMIANLTDNKMELVRNTKDVIPRDHRDKYDDLYEELLTHMPRALDRQHFREIFNREALLKAFAAGETSVQTDFYYINQQQVNYWGRCSGRMLRRPGSGDVILFVLVSDVTGGRILETLMSEVLVREYDFIGCIDLKTNGLQILSTNAQSARIEELHGGNNYNQLLEAYIQAHMFGEDARRCSEFMNLNNVVEALEFKESCFGTFQVQEGGETRNKRVDFHYLDREAGLLAVIRTDYTEVQQQQLEQEEKLRTALSMAEQASVAKTQFLSRMSHEIRTPMNAIIGLDTIALQEPGLSKTMEDHLAKIGISARFLLSLINDILDMSRIESGRMLLKNEEFDFHRFLDSINTILNAQCQDKGLTYECVLKGYIDERYVGDDLKLQQVLINILGNAVKFTPKGGKVQLLIEQVGRNGDNAKLCFAIRDTGEGIEENFLPHIFEAFTQENNGMTSVYGGSGLGLAISKNLVRLMDGNIDVHSVKGMGSTFMVTVKLGLPAQSLQRLQSETIALSALKTLIVDDDVIDCQHAEIVLKQAGIAAEWIDSGAGAVKLVIERHALHDDFRLILVDWKMPDMDGLETVRLIRKIVGPEVTILILTAYDWSEIEQQARTAGVDNFMRKPVFVSSVIQAYDDARLQRHHVTKHQDYDFRGKKALLVEDNKINSEIAKRLLELKGFEVALAGNGVDAIEKFTKSKVGEFAVILMDIRMPFMDGLEAARTIRTIRKADATRIPIVAMSANAFEEDVQKSLASGMNAHLSKPLDAELMFSTLEKLIFNRKE